jgi:hypothetical protein
MNIQNRWKSCKYNEKSKDLEAMNEHTKMPNIKGQPAMTGSSVIAITGLPVFPSHRVGTQYRTR